MIKKQCPACGYDRVSSTIGHKTVAALLGPPVKYNAVTDVCGDCGEAGDFEAANDAAISEAIKESELTFVRSALNNIGLTDSEFERAMRIPQGTTKLWRQEHNSAAAALLRCVKIYPWLVYASSNDFKA